ncbi:MAG: FG-GAP-like repeat-containing protein [Acidobacteria bacterium]|nr:FG-GAP-like repeat-containing protein [Acidobacteriota bacterium]MCA1638699.1 FG-GAP-like repeat-containing protein [Acidobacteriota bacterium]
MLFKNAYKKLCSLTAALLLVFFLSTTFYAAPGDLDTTFGSGGKVITPITEGLDYPTRVRIQPDGKIVTVGFNDGYGFYSPVSFLVRHNADGTVDNSFGTNGLVIVTSISGYDIPFTDFVILPDGKFLVTGNRYILSSETASLVIYRYTANGTLDASFGTNGVITTSVGGYLSEQRIVLQPDGKFVVACENYIYQSFYEVAVVRYNPNGTLDITFGTGGVTRTSIGNRELRVREILVQTDGKLLVAGFRFASPIDSVVLRYNPNGTLDNSFGANGIVQTNIDNQSTYVRGMALQPDGKIIVNGYSYRSSPWISFIARYNTNGTLDNTFGANGIVRITEFPLIGYALAIQQNGKILTAGQGNSNFAISRYNSNGTIDTSFGTNGVIITPIGSIQNYITSIALQTDGKIIAVGGVKRFASPNSLATDVGLVRYLGDAVTTAPRTRFDFDGDGKADISVFRPSNGTWYLQQPTSGFTGLQFGIPSDKLVPADYDGDGKTDVAVYRDGIWYLQRSSQGSTGIAFGAATDIPVPADFDGDGKAELAVFRPSNGVWYLYNLTNNQNSAVAFGTSGDIPVAADYDGDGKADVAVFRPSNGIWYLQRSQLGFTGIAFGTIEDKPVPADYDGDGKADVAVFRPSNGVWYLQRSTLGFTGIAFGLGTDIPTPADYDGDGKTDISFFRQSNGTWYLQQSTSGFTGVQFGAAADIPVPNAFVP